MKKTAVLFLMMIMPVVVLANMATPCEVVFSDPNAFAEAMTKGLVLREGQDSLMNLYLTRSTPYPQSKGEYTLFAVLNVLNRHPELKKLRLREQILEFPITERTSPESLKTFVLSLTQSAGRIRNNLFQIEANLGFYMKLLDFRSLEITNAKPLSETEVVNPPLSPVEVSPPTQGKSAKKGLKKQQQEDFIKWLNTTPLNQETRDFIKDTSQPYWERTVTLYRALEEIRRSYPRVGGGDNNQVVQRIGQAMADLVHTVGFGNEGLKARLKSIDPAQSYSALRDILNERDRLAFDLGFEGHFKELKEALDSKIADETKILQQIHQDIQNQPATITEKQVLRLRPLSIQESPFRSCLGGDCASTSYFEKALDPNFLYFTLTDSQHRSFGHVTVVLGEAKNNQGLKIKVGFVDKIQGVSLERLNAMLEGIRLSLEEQHYVLTIPKEMGGVNGLANEHLIRHYVQQDILPHLKHQFKSFNPHKNKYNFYRGLSRAEHNLMLYQFESMNLEGVYIQAGKVHQPQLASLDLTVRTLYEPILKLEKSTKEADQSKFLSHLLNIHGVRELGISNQYVRDHLHFVLNNKDFSFKIRKQVFYTLLEFFYKQSLDFLIKNLETDSIGFFNKITASFSTKEQQIIIGEMSNWKNTTDYRKNIISFISMNRWKMIKSVSDLKQELESFYGTLLDKNEILVQAVTKGSVPQIRYLLERGADPNTISDGYTVLRWALMADHIEIAKMLLDRGANPNIRNNVDNKTALMWASRDGHTEIAKMLLDREADPNIKDIEGFSPLIVAAINGHTEIVKMLLERGADPHTKDSMYSKTALMWAVENGHTETVKILREQVATPSKLILWFLSDMTKQVYATAFGKNYSRRP